MIVHEYTAGFFSLDHLLRYLEANMDSNAGSKSSIVLPDHGIGVFQGRELMH